MDFFFFFLITIDSRDGTKWKERELGVHRIWYLGVTMRLGGKVVLNN